MRRREFVTTVATAGLSTPALAQAQAHHHDHRPLSGPLASATVSFGAWPASTAAPLDRFATPNAPAAANAHVLLPHSVIVKEGGSVNFVIAGFHVVAVYGPGTEPDEIDASDVIALPGAPPGFPPAINDPTKRVYRGPNPIPLPQDRVECVQFNQWGTYLVICAFLPHFVDKMWGYVRVIR